jgi:hypothetical protein
MEAHASKVRKTYIAGAGVSGALLAGAAILFISLIGLVSFWAWPQASDRVEPLNVELAPARPVPSTQAGSESATPAALNPLATATPASSSVAGGSEESRGGRKGGAAQKGKDKTTANVAGTAPSAAVTPVPPVPDTATPPGQQGRSGIDSSTGSQEAFSGGGGGRHLDGKSSVGKHQGKGKAKGKTKVKVKGSPGSAGRANGNAYGHANHGS